MRERSQQTGVWPSTHIWIRSCSGPQCTYEFGEDVGLARPCWPGDADDDDGLFDASKHIHSFLTDDDVIRVGRSRKRRGGEGGRILAFPLLRRGFVGGAELKGMRIYFQNIYA